MDKHLDAFTLSQDNNDLCKDNFRSFRAIKIVSQTVEFRWLLKFHGENTPGGENDSNQPKKIKRPVKIFSTLSVNRLLIKKINLSSASNLENIFLGRNDLF